MKALVHFFMISLFVVSFVSCKTVPFTNRKQVNLLPKSMMMEMSLASYGDFLKQNPAKPSNDKGVQQIRRVGGNIAQAVDDFLRENKMADRIDDFQWEFNLVEDKLVNAWCMPGGKVVFYTGIMPICKDDGGIAVVMGHEIAHALARHGNERMSQQLALQLGGMSLSMALQEKPEMTQQIFLTSYGIGSTLGSLAYSRKHEYEADKIGMILMAKAGYDPSLAVSFWERMAAAGSGTNVPELLSSHPSDRKRIEAIKSHLPEAMRYYKKGNNRPKGASRKRKTVKM
ncbi:MAG: peptidase M48 [Bacteroidetes bacterium]|nr:MAG: peptidase M48 [Bacteroidota bacterium]